MADDAAPAQDQQRFTSADRIRQLNEVDKVGYSILMAI
jgi:hypothetical protein